MGPKTARILITLACIACVCAVGGELTRAQSPLSWQDGSAGRTDTLRQPMRPTDATSIPSTVSDGSQLPLPNSAMVKPAGYQPPSVESFPAVQSGIQPNYGNAPAVGLPVPGYSLPAPVAGNPYGYTAPNYGSPATGYVPPGSIPGGGYPPGASTTGTYPANPAYGTTPYGTAPYGTAPYGTPPTYGFGQPPYGNYPSQAPYAAPYAPGPVSSPSDYGNLLAPGITNPYAAMPGPPREGPRERVTPIDVFVSEGSQNRRILLGGTVNSELGVAGQLILENRNFDIRSLVPGSQLFYGGGQLLRIELMPGNEVQRYTVNWTQPNVFGRLPYSFSIGGFYYTRELRDWSEQRAGGRLQLGHEITRNLSISSELRMEDVKLFRPRIAGVADVESALGSNDIYRGRLKIAHDTRDSPFMTRRGSLFELVVDQVFGEYDYSRGQINWSRHFLVGQDPDSGTGAQTISNSWSVGITGSQTPVFENFYAGGFSTLRGFEFRGASPVETGVQVGGELLFLGSLEYGFALTQDDLYRGVAFVDYGTVERDLTITTENFRVALGLGLRFSIPALGPAPLAVDFAYPVMMADTDERQIVSFFVGATR